MSADTWERCPVCHNRPEECRNGIDHLYGKILVKEFLHKKDSLDALERIETVRGEYEIYLDNDETMSIDIYFNCQNCGAVWEFKRCIQRNNSMNKRTELDPVHQDRPLDDLGVSEDNEVNNNDN